LKINPRGGLGGICGFASPARTGEFTVLMRTPCNIPIPRFCHRATIILSVSNMGFVGLAAGSQLIEWASSAIETMLKDGELAALAARTRGLSAAAPALHSRLPNHD
jgi:hypothetical protein